MSKLSDSWRTPQELFDELDKEFDFDIDLCAIEENTKLSAYCINYLTNFVKAGELYLTLFEDYIPNTAFMNPPYSNPKPFIEKAWVDSRYCKIVCLVKCDPSTRWWATFWNYIEVPDCPKCNICEGTGRTSIIDRKCRFCFEGKMKWITPIGPKEGCEVRFFPKRIKFVPPEEWEGKVSGPSFPSALIIMDRREI